MNEPVFVLGVDHDITYLAPTIEILEQRLVKGKNALLEIPHEAATWDAKRIYEKSPFFYVVDRYLKARGATTVWGDSYALCQKADEEGRELVRCSDGVRSIFAETRNDTSRFEKELGEISCRERDPRFLAQVKEHQPDIVIVGDHHAAYLVREYYAKTKSPYLYHCNHHR